MLNYLYPLILRRICLGSTNVLQDTQQELGFNPSITVKYFNSAIKLTEISRKGNPSLVKTTVLDILNTLKDFINIKNVLYPLLQKLGSSQSKQDTSLKKVPFYSYELIVMFIYPFNLKI